MLEPKKEKKGKQTEKKTNKRETRNTWGLAALRVSVRDGDKKKKLMMAREERRRMAVG